MVTIPEQEYENPGSHQICKNNEKDTDRAGRWSKIHGLLPFPNGFSTPLVPLPKDGPHDTPMKPFSSFFFEFHGGNFLAQGKGTLPERIQAGVGSFLIPPMKVGLSHGFLGPGNLPSGRIKSSGLP